MEMEREHKWVEEDSCSYQVHIEDNFDEMPMMMKMEMATLVLNSLLPSNKKTNLKAQDQMGTYNIKGWDFRILLGLE